jgi:hypothetical protein
VGDLGTDPKITTLSGAYRASLLAFIGPGEGEALDVGCGEGHVSRVLQLVDHVIIGSPVPGRSSYFSFKEGGVIS